MKLIEENKMGIYGIKNETTGKIYIGSSVRIQDRQKSHLKKLSEGNHLNKELQLDWNLYSGKFSFHIINLANSENELPQLEYEWIEHYKNINGVYNKSNPLEETIRIKIPERDKGLMKEGSTYKLSKNKIHKYLDSHFSNEINKLIEYIKDNAIYPKQKVDEWILKNIKDEEILKDDRINGFINRWYNTKGLVTVYYPYYKREFKIKNHVFNLEEDVLILKSFHKEIHKLKRDKNKVWKKHKSN